MKKIMTLKEIYTKFPDEWIFVKDPKFGKSSEVKKGEVLFHSKDRDEMYRKAIEFGPKHSAFLYTGSIPKGTVVVL